tara:strand:- start:345 stop:512 length:168 start_codon:yes stop_codon:yes gene_type:complete
MRKLFIGSSIFMGVLCLLSTSAIAEGDRDLLSAYSSLMLVATFGIIVGYILDRKD